MHYCKICEKIVETSYLINEKGQEMAKGICGHLTRIEKQQTKLPTLIFKGSGFHTNDYKGK